MYSTYIEQTRITGSVLTYTACVCV